MLYFQRHFWIFTSQTALPRKDNYTLGGGNRIVLSKVLRWCTASNNRNTLSAFLRNILNKPYMKFFIVIDCTHCSKKGTYEIKSRGQEIKSVTYIATCNNFKMKLYSTHLLGLCDEHNVQQTLVYIVTVVHCLHRLCMLHNDRQWRVKNLRIKTY